jgi:hypothetical protein
MINALIQILLEENRAGEVELKIRAHHSGVHATYNELRRVSSVIEAIKATANLAGMDPVDPMPKKKKVTRKRLPKPERKLLHANTTG